MVGEEAPHRVHRYLRRIPLGESEDPRGYAAERDRFQSVRMCQIEAGPVAGPQEVPVPVGQRSAHDRSHGVYHMGAGQVVRAGDAGAARRFLPSIHHLRALRAQLHARVRVYLVVYASVARREASEHPAVGGVDDGVASEGRDVPAPDAHAVLEPQGVDVDDTLPLSRIPQVRVLHREDIVIRAHGRAHVHQRAEQPPPRLRIRGDVDPDADVLREPPYEEGLRLPPFIIVHIAGNDGPRYI